MSAKTFSVHMKLLENYLFEVDFGEFGNIMTDEPPPLGDGEGPNPSAMLAASVANCMSASLLFALRKYKNDPGELSASVTGTVDRVEKYLRVTQLNVEITLGRGQSELPDIGKAMEQFESFCVVTQSVRHGVPVSVVVKDSAGDTIVV
ncbi:OsmC family protein [Pseudohongiella spirulinae]|uniref:Peroxiredoxin n=1 Tax=Pseudohongiella spirulinae TaxID=1249552 RepID=A0A0S2KAI1_9GAMM|nr:OsmC family protein [Pseudohongiella spirulinae]ALO45339.1 peroxiredoxin [Pseudohongiella spirulinae]